MNEAKHTPKWLVIPMARGKRLIVDRQDTADIDVAEVFTPNSDRHAALIAAAPDLLRELQRARDALAELPQSLGYSFTHLESIDAAIRRATTPAA